MFHIFSHGNSWSPWLHTQTRWCCWWQNYLWHILARSVSVQSWNQFSVHVVQCVNQENLALLVLICTSNNFGKFLFLHTYKLSVSLNKNRHQPVFINRHNINVLFMFTVYCCVFLIKISMYLSRAYLYVLS